MVPMDLKGLSWIGNVYEKFEAMCLEVEEILYQDTVDYVENQVQTVNSSVKRFYSDVMEDLAPSSGDYSKKSGASDLRDESHANAGSYRKLKGGMKKEYTKFNVEKAPEDFKVITNLNENAGHVSNIHRRRKINNLSSKSSGAFEKDVSSVFLSRQNINKCIGLKPKPGLEESYPLAERPRVASSLEKNLNIPASSGESYNETTKSLQDQMALHSTETLVEGACCVPMEEKLKEDRKPFEHVPNTSTEKSSPGMIDMVDPAAEEGKELNFSFPDSAPEQPNDLASADVCQTGSVAMSSHLLEDLDAQCGGLSDKVSMSCPAEGDKTIREPDVQNHERDDMVDLEECVLVDEEELQFITHKLRKQEPYKKRIQGALSPFKSSGRKKEYEQLARQFGNDDDIMNEECATSNVSTVMAEKRKNPITHDLHDSEWEFL